MRSDLTGVLFPLREHKGISKRILDEEGYRMYQVSAQFTTTQEQELMKNFGVDVSKMISGALDNEVDLSLDKTIIKKMEELADHKSIDVSSAKSEKYLSFIEHIVSSQSNRFDFMICSSSIGSMLQSTRSFISSSIETIELDFVTGQAKPRNTCFFKIGTLFNVSIYVNTQMKFEELYVLFGKSGSMLIDTATGKEEERNDEVATNRNIIYLKITVDESAKFEILTGLKSDFNT